MDSEKRFWERVSKTENCWNWAGHPSIWDDGHSVNINRFAYRLYHGSFDEELYVLRNCDTTNCVRQEHLFLSETKEQHRYTYNLTPFYEETATSYYLLGVYMTDGNIWSSKSGKSKAVRLTSKDKDWVENIKNLICQDIQLYQKNGAFEFGIYSSELSDWLVSKGCVSSKSLILQFPKVPKEYIFDFIRGCWDGDGTIGCYLDKKRNIYTYRASIISGSKSFILSLKDILNDLGYSFYISERMNKPHTMSDGKLFTQKNPYFELKLSGAGAVHFIQRICHHNHVLSMPRKNTKALEIIALHGLYGSGKVSC